MAQGLIFNSKRLSFASFLAYPSAEKLDAIQLVLRTMRVVMGRTCGLVPEDIGCVCCTTSLVNVIIQGLHMYYLCCFPNVMKLAETIFKDAKCQIPRFLEREHGRRI